MIGIEFESNLKTVGGSASSGMRPRTRSTRVRTSSAASFRSVPQANCRRTLLLPSAEVEFTCFQPGDGRHRLLERPRDELLHLERTRHRCSSTRTVMLGNSLSGIRSTGSLVSEIPPSSITTRQIMNIVTGRWMARRGMLIRISEDADVRLLNSAFA